MLKTILAIATFGAVLHLAGTFLIGYGAALLLASSLLGAVVIFSRRKNV